MVGFAFAIHQLTFALAFIFWYEHQMPIKADLLAGRKSEFYVYRWRGFQQQIIKENHGQLGARVHFS